VNLETPKRPSVGTTASASARALPRVRWLLIISLIVVTMLASTGAPANASDHRCGVISAAKWTERGRSGKQWVVSAYHVDCGFAEAWARRLTHAKIIDQGVFKTHPILDPRGRFPAHFDCEIHRIFNAHPYSEGVCVHLPETSNDPNFAWGIQH
jgi:hypothetical protein